MCWTTRPYDVIALAWSHIALPIRARVPAGVVTIFIASGRNQPASAKCSSADASHVLVPHWQSFRSSSLPAIDGRCMLSSRRRLPGILKLLWMINAVVELLSQFLEGVGSRSRKLGGIDPPTVRHAGTLAFGGGSPRRGAETCAREPTPPQDSRPSGLASVLNGTTRLSPLQRASLVAGTAGICTARA